VVNVSSDTLVLRSFNAQLGYDNLTSAIFDPVNVGTITYHFMDTGTMTYLEQDTEFNGNVIQHFFLRNALVRPDSTNYIFRPVNNDFSTIEVVFRFGGGFWTGTQQQLSEINMQRGEPS